MSLDVYQRIEKEKIVAIVRGIPLERMPSLGEALLNGGISCIELTFDRSGVKKDSEILAAIKVLCRQFGNDICVGAGTVTSTVQVRLAAEAGAEYMISPNTDEDVIRMTKKLGKVSIPGAMTPTEIMFAHKAGADIVKLFPAGVLGLPYIKSIGAPLSDIPLMATGGINTDNAAEYLRLGSIALGVGGNLVNKAWIMDNAFEHITETARAFQAVLSALQV